MTGEGGTPRERSRLRWLPPRARNSASRRADRWACTRFGEIVRREAARGAPSEEVALVATEAFVALFQPDREMTLPAPFVRKAIADQFHRLYYASGETTWLSTRYRGVRTLKIPLDLWIYQEMIEELRPALIVETGTFCGGSALYLADLCELAGRGHIVSIDVEPVPPLPPHDRITYLQGSSTENEIVARVRALLPPDGTVLVILDSDHSARHVREEMTRYAPMVTLGSYLVVEDTAVDLTTPSAGPGPLVAVEEFLASNDEFQVDSDKERLLFTSNPKGYLKRVRTGPR